MNAKLNFNDKAAVGLTLELVEQAGALMAALTNEPDCGLESL